MRFNCNRRVHSATWGATPSAGRTLPTFDAGIFRTLNWAERYSCQLRFEIFNLFNHSNFSVPNFPNRWVFLDQYGTINPAAGRITQTVSSSRQLQFAIRFNF